MSTNPPSGRTPAPGPDILNWSAHRLGRRKFVAAMGGSALVAAVLAACGKDDDDDAATTEPSGTRSAGDDGRRRAATTAAAAATTAAGHRQRPRRRPAASPAAEAVTARSRSARSRRQTGPLASFAEADDFIIAGIEELPRRRLMVGGTSLHRSRSSPRTPSPARTRRRRSRGELITDDKIDLMVVASTPETTNPVADQCEANGVPVHLDASPRGSRGSSAAAAPTRRRAVRVDVPLLLGPRGHHRGLHGHVGPGQTNKRSAGSSRTTATATPGATPSSASRRPLAAAGYTIVDPGRYENRHPGLHAPRSPRSRTPTCEILTGVPIPPDFTTFWKQAMQQGFKPKVASIGKALLFPASVEALGDLGDGLSSEVWWCPATRSRSLTGASAQELADGYTAATGKQWTQPIGFAHALFEVAIDALKRTPASTTRPPSATPSRRPTSTRSSARSTGPRARPFPNVAKTPLVGGQWRKGTHVPATTWSSSATRTTRRSRPAARLQPIA